MKSTDAAIAEILDKLTKLTEANAAQAVDMALAVVRWEAIGKLTTGALCLATAVALTPFAVRLVRKQEADWHRDVIVGDRLPWRGTIGMTMSLCALGFSATALDRLLSTWNWIGALEPKLALAAKILSAAGIK